jgi:hypothetical protein
MQIVVEFPRFQQLMEEISYRLGTLARLASKKDNLRS